MEIHWLFVAHFIPLTNNMVQASRQSVENDAFGFTLDHGPTATMSRPHRHNEIEMTVLDEGWVEYLFGGSRVNIPADTLCVRWAAIPHQSLAFEPGGMQYSLKIPLAWFLQWQLPDAYVKSLLGGSLLMDREQHAGCSDWAMFRRWYATFHNETSEHRRIVLLEAEGRLRRMALKVPAEADQTEVNLMTQGRLGKVERMAVFVASHYTQSINIADIAEAAGLHPNSAMRLFRSACGMTLLEYLTLHRVWHAQRLLAATDMKIQAIAADCGFSAPSRFYAAFKRIVGQLPSDYRASVASPGLM